MEFEVPKHISRPTLSIDMVQQVSRWARGKRGAMLEKDKGSWHRNIALNFFSMKYFFGAKKMKSIEDKRKVKLDSLSLSLYLVLG
jgi:hypothetical protein